MSDVALFFHAVSAYWMSYVGVALTVMSFIQPWIEKRFPKLKPLKLLWGIGAVLLIVALYQAWLGEHVNSETLIVEKAKLAGENGALREELAKRPLPSEIITGDEVVKARRRKIREYLGSLIPEYDALWSSCLERMRSRVEAPLSLEDKAACEKKKDDFDKKVESYLRSHREDLDSADVEEFKRNASMGMEVLGITDILKELKK
jgi:hypothetical protein